MILPVVAFGHPVLRKVCDDITPDYPGLTKLIADMWDTVYNSNGVGIAAPQINKPIRLFVIDTVQVVDDFDDDDRKRYPNEKAIKQVFINAHIIEETGDTWAYNEGCLSIPHVREDIHRQAKVHLRYLDENFVAHEGHFHGITARVIQHEYDHIEGKLFIDYISGLKKRLMKKKLDDISSGKVKVDYRMIFPK
ncbi:peptide deformylase [Flavipsychrobacter stenotrophus]|uniref:Peptide deformylase n=1 Tax=Flavipsychrobacter stenotrophus TaxID=2077091 RepID=A0A2S7SZT5_9BACT|nr:peptide deformylase [Flavipsychrobacter stenotrophus]PQJ12442.1 peptide deformylase [Flavipsychrobacter stenotrophus]